MRTATSGLQWPRVAIATVAIGAAVSADASDRPSPPIFRSVIACRALASDMERLACYDRQVAEIEAAERRGDVVIADRTQIRQSKRALFGFGVFRLPIFGDRDPEGMPREIEAKLTSYRNLGYDKWEFRLDDSSRWRTLEPLRAFPRDGDKVKIRAGALGTYFLRVGSERSVRAMRIQ